MQKIILILLVLFPFCVFSQTNSFVTELYLANNFTSKSGITPGSNNTLFMDCDQILTRYNVVISGTTTTGDRLPSQNQVTAQTPTVETLSFNDTGTYIRMNGEIIDNGGETLTSWGFRLYNENGWFPPEDEYQDYEVSGTPQIGEFYLDWPKSVNLSAGNTYHYQAYAINSNGTAFGAIESFIFYEPDYWAISGSYSSTYMNSTWVETITGTVYLKGSDTPPASGWLHVNVGGIPEQGDSVRVQVEFDGDECLDETATSNGYLSTVSFYPLSTLSYAEESFNFTLTFYLDESIVDTQHTLYVQFEECTDCYITGDIIFHSYLPNPAEDDPTYVYPVPVMSGSKLTIKNNHEATLLKLYSSGGTFITSWNIYQNLLTQQVTIPSGLPYATYRLGFYTSGGSLVKTINIIITY